ncbi:hypothetical protein PENCOP_c005G04138 [Penicillium coprophilum]|uniref:DUF3752 domain-containing protein n=1 Tax=Penicillium coprophilum TaxID=36646 RepID=A0A1V6US85_9EURO|nr:hypothetical protein PENCOP_c005G04138 [Penicillium coprophilum]
MDSKDKRKLEETDHQSVSKQRKVIGPSLPPPQADSETSSDDDDDDDDDDFGPSLPPSGPLKDPVHTEPTDSGISKSEKESQRDQWMLQPPSHSDWASKIDPTQLRNRKFNTSKSATAPKSMDSSWVETPEERMKRLQDAVMGVSGSATQSEDSRGASNARLIEDQIKRYKDVTGKNTRLEKPGVQKEDDDPSARAFDREKDMAVASKISNAQRREMVKKAADYNTRFTKGNFL